MVKNDKIKSICASFVAVTSMFSCVAPINAANELNRKTVEAAYGTPIIDGEIDDIWDTTNLTYIDRLTPSGDEFYTGWFKVLWDENKLYVLGKIYTSALNADSTSAWKHDCLELFVDENCRRTTSLEDDDYQLRSNFEGYKTAKNYSAANMDAAATTFDTGFTVEFAFPMKSTVLSEGKKMGFDAQVYRTASFDSDAARVGWSAYRSDISNDTSDWGTLELKKTVPVSKSNEPELMIAASDNGTVKRLPSTSATPLIENVSAVYDHTVEKTVSILHVNEYPCMEINALAELIGASVESGKTLKKDGISVTYTAGERLIQDNKGNIIAECKPKMYGGKLYVPVSSLETTLLYDVQYNRFAKQMDIMPFHEPAEAEFVANVKDYGAVGDGVTNDNAALLAAFNAAISSGKPARVELEPNKTYYAGETMDNCAMFWVNSVEDFVFDGNGSTLLLAPSQFGAFGITKSERVRIEDIVIDAVMPMISQGTIRGINPTDGTLTVELDEGYLPLPTKAWAKSFDRKQNFVTLIEAGTTHLKRVYKDYFYINGMEHVSGRTYKIQMASSGEAIFDLAAVGDRFTANYTLSDYDLGDSEKRKYSDGMFQIGTSGDIELRNINTKAAKTLGVSAVNTWGNIRLNNFSASCDNGQIWANGRDFLHTQNVRGTMVFENSTVVGNGDDIINTKSSVSKITKADGRLLRLQNNGTFLQGDEVLIVDSTSKDVVGRAFLADVNYVTLKKNAEVADVTLDRDIDGIDISTMVIMNVSAGNGGTVVRNNTFKNGRRYVWLNRSPNCIFEDNYCENNAGSMVEAENEWSGTLSGQAPYPSAFTIRNNHYYSDGEIRSDFAPIRSRNYEAQFGSTAAIDGLLIEGNTFEQTRTGDATFINLADVDGLYLIDNICINHGTTNKSTMPVTIRNSVIGQISGISLQYDSGAAEYGVHIAGCEYDASNITGITGASKSFIDYWK